MIGAAVGGIVGTSVGWVGGYKRSKRRLHPKAKLALALSVVAGIVVTIVGATVAGMWFDLMSSTNSTMRQMNDLYIGTLVFAPTVLIIPFCAVVLIGMKIFSSKVGDQALEIDGGVPCMSCGYDLRASLESVGCPECGAAVSKDNLLHYATGMAVAWRMTWMTLLFSVVGTGLGYLIMVPLCFGLS